MKKMMVLLCVLLSCFCISCAFNLKSTYSEQSESKTYTITYETNGGSHSNHETYTAGTEVELKGAVKTGYTFIGWYSDDAYTEEIFKIKKTTKGDLTLYAKFEAIEYTITYEGVEGAENPNPTVYTIESDIMLESPIKSGYTLDYWRPAADWKPITRIPTGTTGNITIAAVWTLDDYSITYHNVEANNHENSELYNIEQLPMPLLNAHKRGYAFLGWYTEADGGEKIEVIPENNTGNLELYAHWETIEYTATFEADGEVVEEVPFTVETESIIVPEFPSKEYYNGVWGDYVLGVEDITICAVYTPITYTITYTDTKDATNRNVNSYTVESGKIVLLPLQKTGYKFEGWYSGEDEVVEIAPGSHEDMTLTAKWSLVTYNITYANEKGVTNSNPSTYTIESENFVLEDVTLVDYIFDGWYDEQGKKVTEIDTGVCKNITLTAGWIYNISSVQNLKNISSTGSYRLTADLNLNGAEWTPLQEFSGVFDGNGHTISNFTIPNALGSYVAFFARNTGVIKNLIIEEFAVSSNANSFSCVGGLVGENKGTVSNCHAFGSVGYSLSNETTDDAYVGGLVGYNYEGTITKCSASVYIGASKSDMVGSSEIHAGGLLGHDYKGTIDSCYATGNVYCAGGMYNYGQSIYAGGLVGYAFDSSVQNCYATGETTARGYLSSSRSASASAQAGGLVGTVNGYPSCVQNCFATGNVKSTAVTSAGDGLYGYSAAYRVTDDCTNCYYLSGQSAIAIHDGDNKYYSSSAVAASLQNLTSQEWIAENLGWLSDVWNFAEGEFPTLRTAEE